MLLRRRIGPDKPARPAIDVQQVDHVDQVVQWLRLAAVLLELQPLEQDSKVELPLLRVRRDTRSTSPLTFKIFSTT